MAGTRLNSDTWRKKKPRRLTVVCLLIVERLSSSPDRHSQPGQHRPDQNRGRFGKGIDEQNHIVTIATTVADEQVLPTKVANRCRLMRDNRGDLSACWRTGTFRMGARASAPAFPRMFIPVSTITIRPEREFVEASLVHVAYPPIFLFRQYIRSVGTVVKGRNYPPVCFPCPNILSRSA